ncbi:TPA: hypothetical protein J1158_004513 [Escherichia coli]|nr:hypothetical protein [Escherichia coli]HBA8530250.1 hypothetical protein [Escherichia coli]
MFIERMGVSANNDVTSVAMCARGAITYGIFWINPVYMRTRAKPVISLMLYQYIISLMFRVNTDLPGT